MSDIRSHTRAQAVGMMKWREAAELVSARWRTYVDSEPQSRAFAFASFRSALDAEEVAAADMAARQPTWPPCSRPLAA